MSLALVVFLLSALASGQESLTPISFLVVSDGPSWEPSINNSGEIVYLTRDEAGYPNVFSTRRGQLTRSTTGHLRFPDLNEAGELVYADRVPPSTEFQIWSSARGLISRQSSGNTPALSDSGEICFVKSDSRQVELHTDRRGRVLDLGDTIGTTCDVNSSGEIVYRSLDDDGNFQIFSSTRSQLTHEPQALLGSPSVNNHGQVVWVQSGELHSLEEGQMTEFGGLVGFRIDLNDHGDVVFPYRQKKTFIIVLATRFPERYPDFRPLKYESLRDPGLEVVIVIDPLGNPAVVDLASKDLQSVAILSTQESQGEPVDFDASKVDPLSVRFGPAKADIVVRSMSARQDVDGDGDTDMLLFFRPNRPGFGCGDTEALLVGRTRNGEAFQGVAEVRISGCE